jgi:hypothetical protein
MVQCTPSMHLECMGLMCSLCWTISSVSPLLLDTGIVPHSRPEDTGQFNVQTENCITSAVELLFICLFIYFGCCKNCVICSQDVVYQVIS